MRFYMLSKPIVIKTIFKRSKFQSLKKPRKKIKPKTGFTPHLSSKLFQSGKSII